MNTKKFIRNKEDFICDHCGTAVKGGGYTNHCPVCLFSMHVDIHPGDRKEDCGGLMEPIGVVYIKGAFTIQHKCVTCGAKRKVKATEADNADILIALSKNVVYD